MGCATTDLLIGGLIEPKKESRRLWALELAGFGVDHGVVAGAEVAGGLAGAGRDAAAVVAADVAHLVAHLVHPVLGASPKARRRALYLLEPLPHLRELHCMPDLNLMALAYV